MKHTLKTFALSSLLALAGTTAFAQMDAMEGHGGMHHDPAKMEARHTEHLNALKARLKISANQEAAWSSFTEAMKPPATLAKRPDTAELDKLSTPERMDKMRALHKERMASLDAAMEKRIQATKTLYAALTPEQQKIMDAEHAKMEKRAEHAHHHPAPSDKP